MPFANTLNRRLTAVLLLAFVSVSVLLFSSRWGVGMSPDSVAYIGAAQNMVIGRGLTVPYGAVLHEPLTHHAPLFPLLLAAIGMAGIDPQLSAGWLNAVLFGANALLIALIVAYYTPRLGWITAVAALLFLSSPSMLMLHLMAWTEPLFHFFTLVGLFCVALYLEKEQRRWLWGAAVATGLALLTRYSGVALLLTGGTAVLFLTRTPWRRQLLPAFLFALLAVLPLTLWLLRNVGAAGTAANRQFAFHPMGLTQIRQAVDTVANWLLIPLSAPLLIKIGAPLLLVGILVTAVYLPTRAQSRPFDRHYWAETFRRTPAIVKLLLLFSLVYLAFLVFSISFVDAATPLDERILSPLFIVALILLALIISDLWQQPSSRWVQLVVVGVGILFITLQFGRSYALAAESFRQGLGFNNRMWDGSDVLSVVRLLPATTAVYANSPEAVYIHTGHPTYQIPRTGSATSQQANPNFQAELDTMQHRLREQQGVVIYFDAVQVKTIPQAESLRDTLGLSPIYQGRDGTIYALTPP